MPEANAVAAALDRLREGAAQAATLDDTGPLEAWERALATAQPLPSVRSLTLPALVGTPALRTSLAAVFPSVEELTLAGRADEGAPAPSAGELLAPWWNHPLTRLALPHARAWGAASSPAPSPRFVDTLEALSAPRLRRDELAALLRALGAPSGLRALDAGQVDDPGAVLAANPRLERFACALDPRFTREARFEGEQLHTLSLRVHARSGTPALRFAGTLPALRSLRVTQHDKGAGALDGASLGALVASARRPLTDVHLEAPDAWPLARAVGVALRGAHDALPGLSALRTRASEGDAGQRERTEDFAHAEVLQTLGFELDPASCLRLIDRPAHLAALRARVARLEALELTGEVHAFLLSQPALFAAFEGARRLHFFDAQACTTEAFDALLRALPALERVSMTNNRNPAMVQLRVRSASLLALRLTHFHRLDAWAFDAPALEELELDNCDAADCSELWERYGTGDDTAYGNFSERICAAILDGAPDSALPSLRALTLWNNPLGMGRLCAIEALRVDVGCAAGHPTLERLCLSNVPHLRSLRLAGVPKLRELIVAQCDDEGPGTTWLERADLAGVPEGCAVRLCALSAGRVGLL